MRQKAGNWQPSWILAAILIILIRLLDTDQNCSLDPYPQICIENKTLHFCNKLKWLKCLAPHYIFSAPCQWQTLLITIYCWSKGLKISVIKGRSWSK